MFSLVSGLVINFCCKDAPVRVETSCSNCPVDYLANAETKTACLEELLFVLLLTDVLELPCQLWLLVSWSFGMIFPISLIVFCAMMFISAIINPGIDLTIDKGIGRLYPLMTSLLISFLSSIGWADAPLWLPKVSASSRSCCLFSSLISYNSHLFPFLRMDSICNHRGWRLKAFWSSCGIWNSDP